MKRTIKADKQTRIDKMDFGEDITRSRLAKLIEEGNLKVNGIVVTKPSYKTKADDVIELTEPLIQDSELKAEDIDIDIIYEDDDIALVNKPSGMVVHPGAGHESGTLVSALLSKLDKLSGIGGVKRPGIVHRLDKDTSGLILIAKNDKSHLDLSDQLKNRQMEKHYYAMVHGRLKESSGLIQNNIARSQKNRKKMAVQTEGKLAVTKWQTIKDYGNKTLLDVHIITGRTHQIRVHMAHIGHPVVGDIIYGGKSAKDSKSRLLLQAYSLSFKHPTTGEKMTFTIDIEPCFGS